MDWHTLIALIVAVAFAPVAQAATLYGTVYSWETFDPVGDVLVEVNSTPAQARLAVNGSYSFTIPPGTYVLEASAFEDNRLASYAAENITVEGDGVYVHDVILLPFVGEVFLIEPDQLDDLSETVLASTMPTSTTTTMPTSTDAERQETEWLWAVLAIMAAGGILAFTTWIKTRKAAAPEKDTVYVHLPDDLAHAMGYIQEAGGRLTQKELRQKMNYYSEAKMSLLVADLEDRGLIRKVKKGRGNILIAEDRPRR